MGEIVGRWRRGWVAFLSTRAGAWVIRRVAQPLDRLLLPPSRGRLSVGALLGLFPTLMLTSVGARSGQERTVPLIYLPDGERLILVASNYGSARHPAWYHNLRANPACRAAVGGRERPYLAREVSGAEYDQLWGRALAYYPGYRAYSARAEGRRIPILVLEPAG